MMKVGFEVLHANPNMIHPHMHESWDYPNISNDLLTPTPSNHSLNLGHAQNEVCDWVEHITKHFVEDLPQNTTHHNQTRPSHDNLIIPSLTPNFNIPNSNIYNNLLHFQTNNTSSLVHNPNINNVHEHDDQGLNLMTLLMECAVAISVENLNEAHRMLLELTQVASPYKPLCGERVVTYFAKAMISRVMNSWLGVCSPLVDHRKIHLAFQVFNNVSPFIKFAHFTSNQAILEAVNNSQRIHIIDLDIMQGLQWPAFFHILATTRMEGPPEVRMTAIGASMELLVETGKNLSNFARRIGLSLEFYPIAGKFGEINDVSMLQTRPGETLAVHWLQHSLYDATGPDWKTLRLLEELEPRIVTLVEQDVNHIDGSFLDRFVGSLHYYSTLFDSLGTYLHSDDASRLNVEHGILSREVNNILAIGGPKRSGEDKFRQWRSELIGRHCLVQVPMSVNSMAQAQLILNKFSPANGYSLAQIEGTLRLGWKDTSLYTASAWTSSTPK